MLVVWAALNLATAWPYSGSYIQFVLVLALPGALFRAFDLAFLRVKRRPPQRRWLARIVAIVLGVVAAGLLSQALSALSMSRFERAFAPLVAQAHAKMPAPCPPAASYALEPVLRDYLADTQAGRAPSAAVELSHDAKRFVLRLRGGSIDIDGSTLWYDSAARAWHKFHNDERATLEALEATLKGMQQCRLALP